MSDQLWLDLAITVAGVVVATALLAAITIITQRLMRWCHCQRHPDVFDYERENDIDYQELKEQEVRQAAGKSSILDSGIPLKGLPFGHLSPTQLRKRKAFASPLYYVGDRVYQDVFCDFCEIQIDCRYDHADTIDPVRAAISNRA